MVCISEDIHLFISIQPIGRFQQEPEPSQATGMALAHCILGKFLGVCCHCFSPPLDVPTFSARCLHVQRCERHLAAEGGTLRGRVMFRQISSRIRLPRNSRDLLHVANVRQLYRIMVINKVLVFLLFYEKSLHFVAYTVVTRGEIQSFIF